MRKPALRAQSGAPCPGGVLLRFDLAHLPQVLHLSVGFLGGA